jgi:hypothetical protein
MGPGTATPVGTGTSLEDFMSQRLALPLQQQFATQNIAGTTRTCRATAARLSRRPVLSPLAPVDQLGENQGTGTSLEDFIGQIICTSAAYVSMMTGTPIWFATGV